MDVAFSKLRNSRVREIEAAPRFTDHALIFSRAVYSRATPSISESLEETILYTALILCRLGLQIVDREMSAIKSMYVFFLLLLLLFIYLIKLFIYIII